MKFVQMWTACVHVNLVFVCIFDKVINLVYASFIKSTVYQNALSLCFDAPSGEVFVGFHVRCILPVVKDFARYEVDYLLNTTLHTLFKSMGFWCYYHRLDYQRGWYLNLFLIASLDWNPFLFTLLRGLFVGITSHKKFVN